MEFKEYTLNDICRTITDYVANGSFKSLADNVNYNNQKDYARLIRLVDYNCNYNEENAIWVDEPSYNFLSKSILYGGEIIVSNVGANLGTVFKCPKLNHPMTLGPNAILLIADTKICNQNYLYYYLKSRIGYNKLMSIVSGSAMPKFNKTDLRKLIVRLPNIDIQEKAAKLLLNIDNKIELNNQINNNLLEIIDSLYKNTFKDIENYDKAENIANITIGKTPPRGKKECFTTNENDMKWISISDLGKSGTYIFNTSERLTLDSVDKYNVKVIPKNTIILSFKLTVGRIAITTEDMATNEAIAHFNLKEEDMRYFLYSYLKNFDYAKLGSTSSIATAVNSKIIKAMPIAIPNKETLQNYNEKVKVMFEKVLENEKENQNLEQLRDTLLPKLMNGEIDLENIEI